MAGLIREMVDAMNRQQQQNQQMLMQQQQQMQQALLQQQQAFFQQFNFQPGNGVAPVGQQFARPIGLPEFSKLAPQFDGKSSDPADAESLDFPSN